MNIGINDKLDALISLTAKECGNDDVEMFNNMDTSKVSLDKRFYLKLRQIISKHKHTAAVLTIKKFFVRAAVALMALMSLGFLTIMATPDLRDALFEAVIEWYEDYIAIRFEPNIGDNHEGDDTSSTSLEVTEAQETHATIIPPANIEKNMKPTYIPQGAAEDIVMSNKSGVVIDYYINDDIALSFTQTPYRNKDLLFDNETNILYDMKVNGYSAFVIEYDTEGYAIIWTDGVYYYQICSTVLDIDEMVKIASSVQ